MLATPNPLQEEEFGGDPEELVAVHGYKKSLADLKARHRRTGDTDTTDSVKGPGTGGGAADTPAAKEKAKAKKKKKKDKKDKDGG